MTTRTSVSVNAWLARSAADADERGLAEIKPLLEGLARALAALRSADWNDDAAGALSRPGRDARSPR